jgi:hypothetical protein
LGVAEEASGAGKARWSTEVGEDLASCVSGAQSFSGDTDVLLADGSRNPIAQVRIGDFVRTFDPVTRVSSNQRVDYLWEHPDLLVRLWVGNSPVLTTGQHKFWNQTKHAWTPAQDLRNGDLLLDANGGLRPYGRLDDKGSVGLAYNLSVENTHTYFVFAGDTPLLVHNQTSFCPYVRFAKQLQRSVQIGRNRVAGEQFSEIATDILKSSSPPGYLHVGEEITLEFQVAGRTIRRMRADDVLRDPETRTIKIGEAKYSQNSDLVLGNLIGRNRARFSEPQKELFDAFVNGTLISLKGVGAKADAAGVLGPVDVQGIIVPVPNSGGGVSQLPY